ncbi:MAG TPA: hypothetical protein VFU43_31115 [Streptosporangiaceae bacterium]|nr:hypothetical protein [Streptosporangiaceae bacterium]
MDQYLWEAYKRPLGDVDAIGKAVNAAEAGAASGPDLAAALVLVQAALLDLDRLAHRAIVAAHREGLSDEAIAAVLDLPSAEDARRYATWLEERAALPVDEVVFSAAEPDRAREVGGKAARAVRRRADMATEHTLPAEQEQEDDT